MVKYKNKLAAGMTLCAIVFLSSAQSLQAQLTKPAVNSQQQRMAGRIQQRLAKNGHEVSQSDALSAMAWQQALAKRNVTVLTTSDDGKIADRWVVSFQTNPQWMRASVDRGSDFRFVVDTKAILADLESRIAPLAPAPVAADITAFEDVAKGVTRAKVSGIARSGYSVDLSGSAEAIGKALESGETEVKIRVTRHAPEVTNSTDRPLGDMVLLATGKSDFEGSGAGRKANVRKALEQHLDGIVVEPGAVFSFNSILGPVTLSRGWSEALVIFNGGDLMPAPGGGICQVATTLYRAMLQAGLPVTARANHSLFVHYYEKHGVGIDATIFPGKQDLAFRNDTPGPLFIQAYHDGAEAYVNIYGTPDDRRTVIEGPFFASTQPGGVIEGKTIRANEIVWVQRVIRGETEVKNMIVSRYTAIPRSVPKQYPAASIVVSKADL